MKPRYILIDTGGKAYSIGTWRTRAAAIAYAQLWCDHWGFKRRFRVGKIEVDSRYTRLVPKKKRSVSFKAHTVQPIPFKT